MFKKFQFLIIACLCLTSTMAQDLSDRKVTDLVLFPNQGEFFMSFSLYSDKTEYDWEYLSRNYSSSEITSSGSNIAFMYSLTEMFAIGLELNYVSENKQKTTFGPATTSNGQTYEYKSDGLMNPTIALVYRALDTQTDGYDLNISLSVAPKIEDSESPTTTQDGNVAEGATNFSAGLLWGKRVDAFSWAAGFSLQSYGKAESKDVDDGDLTTASSYRTFTLTGKLKWDITERFDLYLGGELGNTGDFKVTYDDGTFIEYENASSVSLQFGSNIKLTESLYLNLDLIAAGVGDREVKDETNTIVTDTERSYGKFSLGLLANF
ncbi:hypothetical protein [Halobacteriovorax marinus]|uniref:hypothetical protein n=1 Tax=Halobacteriovorax marinus TaxID=97084 RepID=UPI0005CAE7BA|nr:hypothetical protein [Halobacteriovorax marinus]